MPPDVQSTEHDAVESLADIRDSMEGKPWVKDAMRWVGQRIHPNHITAVRIPIGIATLMAHQVSAVLGTVMYSLNTLGDGLDGAAARATGKRTREGAMLDPLVDKIVNNTTLAYAVSSELDNIPLIASAAAAIAVDVVSQLQRAGIVEQMRDAIRGVLHAKECNDLEATQNLSGIQANMRGKIKMALQSVAIGALMLAGQNETVQHVAAAGLTVASIFGASGVWKRWNQAA